MTKLRLNRDLRASFSEVAYEAYDECYSVSSPHRRLAQVQHDHTDASASFELHLARISLLSIVPQNQ